MLKVGLTGGIASGKSHVLRRLAEAGFQTLDLDAVARAVMAPGGSAYGEILEAFGPAILAADGSIDRKALGHHVFADPAARRRLEAIVHPRIREAESRSLSAAAADSVAVIDAALLVETGQHLRFARLVVVYCEPREQLHRLMARDGLSEAAARARLDAQMPGDEKTRFGHFVVDNSGSRAETDARVDGVIGALRAVAADHPREAGIPLDRAVHALMTGPQVGPRGLRPPAVVEAIASGGGLDLARMAALLDPPHDGPWYRAAADVAGGEGPETMAIPVALWSAGQRPGDAPFAIAAAASMARLTHRDPDAVAAAIVAALAAQQYLAGGAVAAESLEDWIPAATAWAGAAPSPPTVATVAAAAAHPGDPETASRVAAAAGGRPDLARALAAATAAATLAPELRARVARVLSPAAR